MYDDFLASVLEPDVFVSSQYASRGLPRHFEGESRLMLAILKDAVECLEKYRRASTRTRRELYQNTVEWIEDRNTEWLLSFTNICDHLGFDPDHLRGFLLKREHKAAKSTGGRVSP